MRRGLGRVRRAVRHLTDPPGLILLYHRVAHPGADPWGLSVRPEHFAQHLEVVRRRTRPAPLRHLPGGGRGVRVVITFDDGYADNLHRALPLLEGYDLPATIFVASGYVGQPQPFWWDELGELLLHGRALPGELRLKLGPGVDEWRLDAAARAPATGPGERRSWRAETPPAPGSRERLYLDLYWRLRTLDLARREAALVALRDWAGRDGPAEMRARDPVNRPVTRAELTELAAHPLVEVGAHTVTHPSLADLAPAAQQVEIGVGKTDLERALGRPVTSFSFPYGSYDRWAADAVRRAGFLRACTTASQSVRRGADPLALPRVNVEDWTGEEFAARLRGWLG